MPRTALTDEIQLHAVGASIREARRRAGLTQAEVARRLGATGPYVSGFENGRTNMTIGQLGAIADALGAELHIEFRVPEPLPEPEIPAASQAA